MTDENKPTNGELFAQFVEARLSEPEPDTAADETPASDDFAAFFGIK